MRVVAHRVDAIGTAQRETVGAGAFPVGAAAPPEARVVTFAAVLVVVVREHADPTALCLFTRAVTGGARAAATATSIRTQAVHALEPRLAAHVAAARAVLCAANAGVRVVRHRFERTACGRSQAACKQEPSRQLTKLQDVPSSQAISGYHDAEPEPMPDLTRRRLVRARRRRRTHEDNPFF
jgi:hypothetical protein